MTDPYEVFDQIVFSDERSLFGSQHILLRNCTFDRGESPLKECKDIELHSSLFRWKYPLWYCDGVRATDCVWFDTARAGVWYSKNVTVDGASISAPKNFRRCDGLTLRDVRFHHAEETMWQCSNVLMRNVTVSGGTYFAMNSNKMEIDGLNLDGNYAFDGASDVVIRNSRLITKDAFWNSKNITVYDSFISGEYLGWNAENLTLINCTVESLQGMCYIDGLKMVNCKLVNTTLAFEYSTVDVDLVGSAGSIFNPSSGTIKADRIDELIMQKDRIDPTKTKIRCKAIGKISDSPEW
ncbi:MAG: DUF3737 family protein [Clostridia bacterium]|nr:DUF3737 family protein [Clostridia bacterium]